MCPPVVTTLMWRSPVKYFSQAHNKQGYRLFLYTISLVAERQAEKLWTPVFKKSFGMTRQGNRTLLYRIHSISGSDTPHSDKGINWLLLIYRQPFLNPVPLTVKYIFGAKLSLSTTCSTYSVIKIYWIFFSTFRIAPQRTNIIETDILIFEETARLSFSNFIHFSISLQNWGTKRAGN